MSYRRRRRCCRRCCKPVCCSFRPRISRTLLFALLFFLAGRNLNNNQNVNTNFINVNPEDIEALEDFYDCDCGCKCNKC